MNRHLTLVCLVLTIVFLPSCASWFRTACDVAMPSLVAGQSYGTDATNAISQAETYAAQLPLTADLRAALLDAIDAARRGVEVGEIAIASAIQTCTATDPATAFKDLIVAWTVIENILAIGPTSSLKVSRRPLYVPAVVRYARQN